MVLGISSAMAWFGASNKKRDRIIEILGEKLDDYENIQQAHVTELALLKNTNESIKDALDDIKRDIQHSAERGAQSVNSQLATVLNEVQKLAAHQQRRT